VESQNSSAQQWVRSSRVLMTVVVRPIKAVHFLLNGTPKGDEDAVEYAFSWIAPISYGTFALAGGFSEAAAQGIIAPIPGVKWFLKNIGPYGNTVASIGGFYAWYRDSRRVHMLKNRTINTDGATKTHEKDRFWNGCNGIRYGLKGAFELWALHCGKFTGWAEVGTKAAPAFVGVSQTFAKAFFGW